MKTPFDGVVWFHYSNTICGIVFTCNEAHADNCAIVDLFPTAKHYLKKASECSIYEVTPERLTVSVEKSGELLVEKLRDNLLEIAEGTQHFV